MRRLHIDIETYSPVNLKTSGMYRYAEEAEVILFAYAFNDDPVRCIDVINGAIPGRVIDALTDPDIVKIAHNAAFERTLLSKHFNEKLPIDQWECSMIRCANAGLPLDLEQASKVLNSKVRKDPAGKALITYFCKPCKPTKTNGGRIRNMPFNHIEKWEHFKRYNVIDVEAERENYHALSFLKITPFEKSLYHLDQKINDKGVSIDKRLVTNAINLDMQFRSDLHIKASEIAGIKNVNSLPQLKRWLEEETNETIESLNKKELPKLLERFEDPLVRQIITIRQQLSKTSIKKYATMIKCLCRDGRIRGLLQFYGANRTGRWAGRLVQIQNLIKNLIGEKLSDEARSQLLTYVRDLVLNEDIEGIELLYGSLSYVLSQLIRTAFVPAPGKKLLVSDFSAIEAVVIAWLANEKWRLEVFNTHGKIYEASAAQMFKIPIESVTKSSNYRAKAKIAELALGYQGGVNALLNMGAIEMGLEEDELKPIVTAWRTANPQIKKFWYDVGNMAVKAINTGQVITIQKNISFHFRDGSLFITLPSGRQLCYYRASVVPGEYGDVVQYWGLNQINKKWQRIKTYGGKLVENIVQATARDCLAYGLVRLDRAGYNIIMHVHDEVVCEEAENGRTLDEMNELITKRVPWMAGLPLRAAGFEGYYYKKD